jgi:hypothetical protein
MFAAVFRAQHDRIHYIDEIGVLRIDGEPAEIPSALEDARVVRNMDPVFAAVVGSVETARAS